MVLLPQFSWSLAAVKRREFFRHGKALYSKERFQIISQLLREIHLRGISVDFEIANIETQFRHWSADDAENVLIFKERDSELDMHVRIVVREVSNDYVGVSNLRDELLG